MYRENGGSTPHDPSLIKHPLINSTISSSLRLNMSSKFQNNNSFTSSISEHPSPSTTNPSILQSNFLSSSMKGSNDTKISSGLHTFHPPSEKSTIPHNTHLFSESRLKISLGTINQDFTSSYTPRSNLVSSNNRGTMPHTLFSPSQSQPSTINSSTINPSTLNTSTLNSSTKNISTLNSGPSLFSPSLLLSNNHFSKGLPSSAGVVNTSAHPHLTVTSTTSNMLSGTNPTPNHTQTSVSNNTILSGGSNTQSNLLSNANSKLFSRSITSLLLNAYPNPTSALNHPTFTPNSAINSIANGLCTEPINPTLSSTNTITTPTPNSNNLNYSFNSNLFNTSNPNPSLNTNLNNGSLNTGSSLNTRVLHSTSPNSNSMSSDVTIGTATNSFSPQSLFSPSSSLLKLNPHSTPHSTGSSPSTTSLATPTNNLISPAKDIDDNSTNINTNTNNQDSDNNDDNHSSLINSSQDILDDHKTTRKKNTRNILTTRNKIIQTDKINVQTNKTGAHGKNTTSTSKNMTPVNDPLTYSTAQSVRSPRTRTRTSNRPTSTSPRNENCVSPQLDQDSPTEEISSSLSPTSPPLDQSETQPSFQTSYSGSGTPPIDTPSDTTSTPSDTTSYIDANHFARIHANQYIQMLEYQLKIKYHEQLNALQKVQTSPSHNDSDPLSTSNHSFSNSTDSLSEPPLSSTDLSNSSDNRVNSETINNEIVNSETINSEIVNSETSKLNASDNTDSNTSYFYPPEYMQKYSEYIQQYQHHYQQYYQYYFQYYTQLKSQNPASEIAGDYQPLVPYPLSVSTPPEQDENLCVISAKEFLDAPLRNDILFEMSPIQTASTLEEALKIYKTTNQLICLHTCMEGKRAGHLCLRTTSKESRYVCSHHVTKSGSQSLEQLIKHAHLVHKATMYQCDHSLDLTRSTPCLARRKKTYYGYKHRIDCAGRKRGCGFYTIPCEDSIETSGSATPPNDDTETDIFTNCMNLEQVFTNYINVRKSGKTVCLQICAEGVRCGRVCQRPCSVSDLYNNNGFICFSHNKSWVKDGSMTPYELLIQAYSVRIANNFGCDGHNCSGVTYKAHSYRNCHKIKNTNRTCGYYVIPCDSYGRPIYIDVDSKWESLVNNTITNRFGDDSDSNDSDDDLIISYTLSVKNKTKKARRKRSVVRSKNPSKSDSKMSGLDSHTETETDSPLSDSVSPLIHHPSLNASPLTNTPFALNTTNKIINLPSSLSNVTSLTSLSPSHFNSPFNSHFNSPFNSTFPNVATALSSKTAQTSLISPQSLTSSHVFFSNQKTTDLPQSACGIFSGLPSQNPIVSSLSKDSSYISPDTRNVGVILTASDACISPDTNASSAVEFNNHSVNSVSQVFEKSTPSDVSRNNQKPDFVSILQDSSESPVHSSVTQDMNSYDSQESGVKPGFKVPFVLSPPITVYERRAGKRTVRAPTRIDIGGDNEHAGLIITPTSSNSPKKRRLAY